MRLPILGEEILKLDNKNLFYQEPCFLPLFSSDTIENDLFVCGFDSKHCLHLVNTKTFDYTYINKEIECVENSIGQFLLSSNVLFKDKQ